MSEPKPKDPWAKFYAARGVERPPLVDFARMPGVKKNGRPKANATPGPAAAGRVETPRLTRELAAAVDAVNAAARDRTLAPFLSAEQREAMARAAQQAERRQLAKAAALAVLALLALHLTFTRVLNREPDEARLDARARDAAAQVLPLETSATQPLALLGVRTALKERSDAAHRRYEAVVRLGLREPLYAPAVSNGTAAYRQLQESLRLAVQRAAELGLAPEAKPPELPLLLERTHQAGETVVVRVPFEAIRFGWRWTLDPAQVANRQAGRALHGANLPFYAGTPHLIFGELASLAEIRARMVAARDYIVAVNQAADGRTPTRSAEPPSSHAP